MRHPLLVMQDSEVVANDVTVRCGSALVISGPNAGGKTIVLKTIGIMVLMVAGAFAFLYRGPEAPRLLGLTAAGWAEWGGDEELAQLMDEIFAPADD